MGFCVRKPQQKQFSSGGWLVRARDSATSAITCSRVGISTKFHQKHKRKNPNYTLQAGMWATQARPCILQQDFHYFSIHLKGIVTERLRQRKIFHVWVHSSSCLQKAGLGTAKARSSIHTSHMVAGTKYRRPHRNPHHRLISQRPPTSQYLHRRALNFNPRMWGRGH